MDYIKVYTKFLKRFIKVKYPLRVVFDCSNGTTGLVLKELFLNNFSSSLRTSPKPVRTDSSGRTISKIDPVFINENPDGNFPGHGPNPLKTGALNQIRREVVKQKADLGIVFDGDGDRVFFIDDLGNQIDPDIIGYILMKKIKAPYIVTTISSWRVKKVKGAFISKVGHLFMKEMMRKKKANFGMERSGHYYFKNFFYCDSGIFAAIQVINFLSSLRSISPTNFIRPKKLSDFIKILPKYFQIPETNLSAEGGSASGGKMGLAKWSKNKIAEIEKKYKKNAVVVKKEDGLLMEFNSPAGEWWLSLRLSNSENLLRLNMEADSQKLLDSKFKEIKKLLIN
jgi:phosphomannomutase